VRPRVLLKALVNILWYFEVHLGDDVQRNQIRDLEAISQSSKYRYWIP